MDQNIPSWNNVKVNSNGTKPMVFAPGFGCDQSVWHAVAATFEEEYQTILLVCSPIMRKQDIIAQPFIY